MIFSRRRSRHQETRTLSPMVSDPIEQDGLANRWPTLDLFQDLSTADVEAIAMVLEPRTYVPGEVIMREGAEGDAMYLLDEGRVRISKAAGEGRPAFSRTLDAPSALGEMALIARTPRTATVQADGAVRCMRLDRADFEAIVQRHPDVARLLTRLVGERLKEIDGIRRVGKYRVVGTLGKGAVADVFEARHPELGQPVALKMLSHALVYHPQFAAQFDREAVIVAGLAHPNIVRVFDFERAYGTRFIVMERLEGEMLADLIERRAPPRWSTVRRLLREVASALHHAHVRGLIHRDVKPSNIFITTGGQAKLLDFGIAVHQERSAATGDARVGSPCYVAPEQILGKSLDGRADIYALGITAFELITGQVPFDAPDVVALLRKHLHTPLPDPRHIRPDMPADLVEFIQGCCKKKPHQRFADCDAALAVLEDGPDVPLGGQRTIRIAHGPESEDAVRDALDALDKALAGLPGVELFVE